MNPSGIYTLVCNGDEGTLELTVDADGNLTNSRINVFGETLPVQGTFNEIDGAIEFRAEPSESNPNLQFNGRA
jgi:hypothetical protein